MTIENGSPLPPIIAKTLDGDEVDLATATAGSWGVVLLYRGHW